MGVTGVFAYFEGSYALRGAKPLSSSFAAATNRGLLLEGVWSGLLGQATFFDGVPRGNDDARCDECMSDKDFLGSRLLRGSEDGVSVSLLADSLLLLPLRTLMFVSDVGVRDPKLPFRLLPTTLLAGELPGVATPRLLPKERSVEMTVKTESRNC